MILISKYIVPKGFTGITLFPFIFLKEEKLKKNTKLIHHEKIHLRQQIELGIVFFYLFYGIEWVFKLIKYKNFHTTYLNLSFEREAYQREDDINYLKNRSFWAFLKYL